jgi:hypothetical protein
VGSGDGTVHGRRTTLAVTHVGRDVGAVLGMTMLLLALGAKAEAAHVKLVRHVDVRSWKIEERPACACVRDVRSLRKDFRKGRQTGFTLVIQRKRE